MANEINIAIKSTEDVGDTIAEVKSEVTNMGKDIVRTMGSSEDAFDGLARSTGKLGERLDFLSGSFSQLSGGVGDVGGGMVAFTDLQKIGATRALEHEQALLDLEQAQADYNAAVKEFGADSLEARQAQAALNQAQEAAKPPTELQKWGENLELISPLIMAAVGATDLLIFANTMLSGSMLKNVGAQIAQKTAMVAGTVATYAATAATWAWNIALLVATSPITLIIIGVAALVAGIVWLATKTTFFQDVWKIAWGSIKIVFSAVWEFIKNSFTTGMNNILSFPGRIGHAFSVIANVISAPFRTAFNNVARFWNSTVGRLSFSIPSWVPGIGGNGFSMPRIPMLQKGGEILRTGLVMAHQGERIEPAHTRGLQTGSSMSGGTTELRLKVSGGADSAFAAAFQTLIDRGIISLEVVNGKVVTA
jgi:hypothetical protein